MKKNLSLIDKNEFDKKLEEAKKKRENNIKSKENKTLEEITNILVKIEERLYSKDFSQLVSRNDLEAKLLYYYLCKLGGRPAILHTAIIDEAQDMPIENIELIHLLADNTILTGDELQKEDDDGIGSWTNLGRLYATFSNNENKLNIFHLRHNFRQTYELGNCSYNFRQFMLNKELIDLNEEYFENQKGYNKPQLLFIKSESDFLNLVRKKILLINELFTDKFPVVIFYENKASLDRMGNILESNNIFYGVDDIEKSKNSVCFISLNTIAGREFPVVIAPLTNNSKDSSIYIMLSRAKYDLTIVTGKDKILNSHLSKLLSYKLIL